MVGEEPRLKTTTTVWDDKLEHASGKTCRDETHFKTTSTVLLAAFITLMVDCVVCSSADNG